MSSEPHDLVARLLRNASEPQHPKPRGPGNGAKSKASKENRGAAAKGKPKSAALPLDRSQLERLFEAAEHTVFAPRAAPPPPADAGCQGAALLRRLTLDPSTTDLPGSPMSIERPPRPAADGPGPSPLGAPAAALAEAAPSPTIPFSPKLPEDNNENDATSPAGPASTQEDEDAFKRRCAADSDALLASCPQNLSNISQFFPKQAEAFTLADQCNFGQPLLPQPEILMAAVSEVPRRGPAPAPVAPAALHPAESVLPPPAEQSSQAVAPPAAPKTNPNGVKFSFALPAAAPDGDGDAEESERKRQRAESDATGLMEIKDAYAAALAQFNAPQAAPRAPAGPAAAAAAASSEDTSGAAPAALPQLHDEAIRVFCVERLNKSNGQFYRSFAATSYAGVWRAYLAADHGTLHWYEVIRDSRPCHLYFDLEFARDAATGFNADVDGDSLVDTLIHHVGAIMARNWCITLDPATQVYELDSSTPEKFSRHVIVRLPGYAFLTNGAAGHTAAQIVAASGESLEVAKAPLPSVERVSFVDMAVYTRNRHFRLAYSSKGGKAAMLRPTYRYATAPRPNKPSPAAIFEATLICNVEKGVKMLAVLLPLAPGMSVGGGGGGGCAVYHTGDVFNRVVTWKRDESEATDPDQRHTRDLKTLAEKGVAFVERVASQRAQQDARARTVAFCGNDGLVAYSMIGPGSHYCENIRRDHKNNHVYYVLNFASGAYAQKCHDPDCSRYRSPWMPLPSELHLQEPPQ